MAIATGGHRFLPLPGFAISWLELILATPVVLWAGWPFFRHGGQRTGSRMKLEGCAFGIPVRLKTEVTQRDPPAIKRWQTVETRVLVIGRYWMTVRIDRS